MDFKGSLSVDLFFATFMILIMLFYMSNLIMDKYNTAEESRELVEARNLAEYVACNIDQVYAGGNGHIAKINLPTQINQASYYKVTVDSSGVLVSIGGRKGLAYMVPKKISDSSLFLKNSTVTLLPGKNYIIINKKEGNGDNWIVIKENR